MSYHGRFAPTPSGPLHLGSLLTALASWLDARHCGGSWQLRIDDLDGPRCVPGADAQILRQLEAHGLHWDQAPRYQSQHRQAYAARLDVLLRQQRLYGCNCTRALLQAQCRAGPDGPVYPGTCRKRQLPFTAHALRFRVDSGSLQLDDRIQGLLHRDAERDIGDFVLRRRDGIVGYHLACVVDEDEQQITDVVRGADLLGASFAQQILQQALDLPLPRHAHVPVLTGEDGRKLSKQNHAAPIDARHAAHNLWTCLQLLGQTPPLDLQGAASDELLAWAIPHWDLSRIAARVALRVEADDQVWHDATQQFSRANP